MVVAVAIVAVILGAAIWLVEMIHRLSTYRQTAAAFDRQEREARKEQEQRLWLAASLGKDAESQTRMPRLLESAKNAAELAGYHRRLAAQSGQRADDYARLRRKYERAATRPWLPIEPDPPAP